MNTEQLNQINSLPCWQGPISVEPLGGGMTNHNFRVLHGGARYVVRLGVDAAEHLLWRENEGSVSATAAKCGFSPAVFYRQPGVLVIDFIDGRVFSAEDVRNPENLRRLVDLLQRFHRQMPGEFEGYTIMFWVFQTLRHYRKMLIRRDSAYVGQIPGLMEIAKSLERAVGSVEIVFGHNDLLPANLIDDGEKIWLIDFDYAGFNSPLFDLSNLASNSELEEEQERHLLEMYFERPVTAGLWRSYHAMKCASLLRETMWSMVSEVYSPIEIDFVGYTRENRARFERAWQYYTRVFESSS